MKVIYNVGSATKSAQHQWELIIPDDTSCKKKLKLLLYQWIQPLPMHMGSQNYISDRSLPFFAVWMGSSIEIALEAQAFWTSDDIWKGSIEVVWAFEWELPWMPPLLGITCVDPEYGLNNILSRHLLCVGTKHCIINTVNCQKLFPCCQKLKHMYLKNFTLMQISVF